MWPDPGFGAEETEIRQFLSQCSEGDKHVSTWMAGSATQLFLKSAFYELFISVLVSSARWRVQKEQGHLSLPPIETQAERGSQEVTGELID